MSLGENIAALRKKAGMTQKELGAKLFVSLQAVSRWEQGGSPDLSVLPKLADLFGVSIDELLDHPVHAPQAQGIEAHLRDELGKVPKEQVLSRANELAFEIFKLAVYFDNDALSAYYQAAGISDGVDFRDSSNLAVYPRLISAYMPGGIMRASPGADNKYTLFMPEPQNGFASVLKNAKAYRSFFLMLSRPNLMEVLAFCATQTESFSASLAAESLRISQEATVKALNILTRHNLLTTSEVRLPEGAVTVYQNSKTRSALLCLYFAAEVMKEPDERTMQFTTRKKALLTDALGNGNPTPGWRTGEIYKEV